jgi:hypothetical protein
MTVRNLHHVSINIHPLTTKQWILKCLGIDRKKLWTYNKSNSLSDCSVTIYVDGVLNTEIKDIEQIVKLMVDKRAENKKLFINLIIGDIGVDYSDSIIVTLWNIDEALYLTLSGSNDNIGVLKNLNNVDFKYEDLKKYNTLRSKVRQVFKDYKEFK